MFRIILLMVPLSLWAQITVFDNFKDGDFSANPSWWGDISTFQVDNNSLRLQDSVAGQAYLALASPISEQAEWIWQCRMVFNPSSSNYLDLILLSDRDSLNASFHGYYLRLGGSKDQLCLWRKDYSEDTLLACSKEDLLDLASLNLKIRIQRDANFNWTVALDSAGLWLSLFSVPDSAYRLSRAAGWFCHYTKTRANLFYLDSLQIVGFPALDSVAPRLQSSSIKKGKLELLFDESLQGIDSAFLSTEALSWQLNGASLRLEAKQGFPVNDSFTVRLYGLKDLFDNRLDTSLRLIDYQAFWGDVKFSEIMFDPSPPVGSTLLGFPEAEYLEVFNSSAKDLDLEDWQLIIDDANYPLSKFNLQAHQYTLFCDQDQASFWPRDYAPIYLPWSIYELANEGSFIGLISAEGRWIDSLYYRPEWLESHKQDGGWSLECRDLEVSCRGAINWTSSQSSEGGSPEAINSVYGSLKDSLGPALNFWALARNDHLVLSFNENLFCDSLAYSINPPWPVESVWLEGKQLHVFFKEPLEAGMEYRFSCLNPLFDCMTNSSRVDSLYFSIAAPLSPGVLRISEVLFNPDPDGIDFVEVYNLSPNPIDLQELRIAAWDLDNNMAGPPLLISSQSRYLASGEVLALCEDLEPLLKTHQAKASHCLEIGNLPSMSDQGSALQLMTSSFEIIDQVAFTDRAHSPFIGDPEGVSLKRLYWQGPAIRDYHWESSTKAESYASPGEIKLPKQFTTNVLWQPDSPYFTPNGDYDKDGVDLLYNFESPGNWGQVYILDRWGYLQCELESGLLLDKQGRMRWNGQNQQGELCESGIYTAVLKYIESGGYEGQVACTLTLIR